jgi:hypothetical protein
MRKLSSILKLRWAEMEVIISERFNTEFQLLGWKHFLHRECDTRAGGPYAAPPISMRIINYGSSGAWRVVISPGRLNINCQTSDAAIV